MTPKKPEPRPQLDPVAMIGWASGHPRHFLTASWLASVYGARVLSKPELGDLKDFLIDLQASSPGELAPFAARVIASLPRSVTTRAERYEIQRFVASPQKDPLELPSALALMGWCREQGRHVLTAWWLLSVHGALAIPRPDFETVERFLIDVRKHAPDELFELVTTMVKVIPSGIATRAERAAYRGLVDLLRLDSAEDPS